MCLPWDGCNKPVQIIPALYFCNTFFFFFNASLWSQGKPSESFYLKFFFDESSAFILHQGFNLERKSENWKLRYSDIGENILFVIESIQGFSVFLGPFLCGFYCCCCFHCNRKVCISRKQKSVPFHWGKPTNMSCLAQKCCANLHLYAFRVFMHKLAYSSVAYQHFS